MAWQAGKATVALTADSRALKTGVAASERVMTRFQQRMQRVGLAFRKIFMAGGLIGGAMAAFATMLGRKAVKAAMVQEEALMKLRGALMAAGESVSDNLPRLNKFADLMQKNTIYGNEFTQGLMAQALALGINADQVEEAIKNAFGLAELMGGSVPTALRYAVLAMKGEYTMLRRYIPAVRNVTTEEEKHKAMIDAVAKGWALLTARTQSGLGALARMKNAWGDLLEVMGNALSKAIRPMVEKLTAFFQSDAGVRWAENFGNALKDVAAELKTIVEFIASATRLFTLPKVKKTPAEKYYERAEKRYVEEEAAWGLPALWRFITTGRQPKSREELRKEFAETPTGVSLLADIDRTYWGQIELREKRRKAEEEKVTQAMQKRRADRNARLKAIEEQAQKEVLLIQWTGLHNQIALDETRQKAFAQIAERGAMRFVGPAERWREIQLAMTKPLAENYARRTAEESKRSADCLTELKGLQEKNIAAIEALGGTTGSAGAGFYGP